jgi:hypothetical protein
MFFSGAERNFRGAAESPTIFNGLVVEVNIKLVKFMSWGKDLKLLRNPASSAVTAKKSHSPEGEWLNSERVVQSSYLPL